MATRAEIEANLVTVRAARLRGVRTVQFADRTVTYTSDAEMRQVEQDLTRDLLVLSTDARPKRAYGVATNGF